MRQLRKPFNCELRIKPTLEVARLHRVRTAIDCQSMRSTQCNNEFVKLHDRGAEAL